VLPTVVDQQQQQPQWKTYLDTATNNPYYALGTQVQWDMPEELRLLGEAALAVAAVAAAAVPPAITLGHAGLLPAGHAHYNSARLPEPPMLTQQQFEGLSECRALQSTHACLQRAAAGASAVQGFSSSASSSTARATAATAAATARGCSNKRSDNRVARLQVVSQSQLLVAAAATATAQRSCRTHRVHLRCCSC
jgi:hypothetical protein